MFHPVFIGILVFVCTATNSASGAPPPIVNESPQSLTLYDAIIAKCPTLTQLAKFKDAEMFKSCQNFTQIQLATNLNLKDHKKELMCLLGYDNIVFYCTTASLLSTNTKTLTIPKMRSPEIEEICDSLAVVSPKTSKRASESLQKALAKKEDCQSLCSNELELVQPMCTVAYNFGKWAEQVQTVLQKQKTSLAESAVKHEILPDSLPMVVSQQGVPESGPQTQKNSKPSAADSSLPQLSQNSKKVVQNILNVSKNVEPAPQPQPQNPATGPQKSEPSQAAAKPLAEKVEEPLPLPQKPEFGEPASKIPIPAQNVQKNPASESIVEGTAEVKAAPPATQIEAKNQPGLSPPKVKDGDKVENDNSDFEQEQDQLQPGDNLNVPQLQQQQEQEADQLDQQQNMAEEEADDEDRILEAEAKEQQQTKEKTAEITAEKPKTKTQIEITKPDKIDESEAVSGYGADGEMDGDSYFFSYFMLLCIIFIVGYVCYHNKQKILALILEGRRGKRQYRSRRPNSANYHKLDSNLEEAISSTCTKNVPPLPV